jgi:hypothetical protein
MMNDAIHLNDCREFYERDRRTKVDMAGENKNEP